MRFLLLYGDGLRLTTVKKLIDHFDPLVPESHKLVPASVDPIRIRQDWKLFHRDVNTATTIFAYHHLLPLRDIMVRPLSYGAARWGIAAVERVERAYPAFAAFIFVLLQPTEQRTARPLQTNPHGARAHRRAACRRPPLPARRRLTLSDVAFAIAAARSRGPSSAAARCRRWRRCRRACGPSWRRRGRRRRGPTLWVYAQHRSPSM